MEKPHKPQDCKWCRLWKYDTSLKRLNINVYVGNSIICVSKGEQPASPLTKWTDKQNVGKYSKRMSQKEAT